MKKMFTKKVGALLAALVIAVLSIGGTVSAEPLTGNEIQPRGMCLNCNTGFTDYVCRGTVVRSETGTHKCGLFWTDTCTVEYQYCYSDLTCLQCGNVTERGRGPHLCVEVHSNCDKGNYKVCPCGYWPN